jgi:hypothetical protein
MRCGAPHRITDRIPAASKKKGDIGRIDVALFHPADVTMMEAKALGVIASSTCPDGPPTIVRRRYIQAAVYRAHFDLDDRESLAFVTMQGGASDLASGERSFSGDRRLDAVVKNTPKKNSQH